MSDSVVFPYSITLQQDGRIGTTPTAEVFFKTKTGAHTSLMLLIDSGATISAMPARDAHVFGLDHKKGRRIDVRGVGSGSVQGWVHMMLVRVGQTNSEIEIPVAFLENDDAPYVLGRTGVFDRFTIVLEEQKNRSGFFVPTSRIGKAISRQLDLHLI